MWVKQNIYINWRMNSKGEKKDVHTKEATVYMAGYV